jgi:hypothetical protein
LKKKLYTKPIVEKIELAVEEAILGDCKQQTGSGPTGYGMHIGGIGGVHRACRGHAKS